MGRYGHLIHIYDSDKASEAWISESDGRISVHGDTSLAKDVYLGNRRSWGIDAEVDYIQHVHPYELNRMMDSKKINRAAA